MPGGSKQKTTIPLISPEEQRARQLGLSEAEARHQALLRELNLAEQGPAAILAGIRGAREASRGFPQSTERAAIQDQLNAGRSQADVLQQIMRAHPLFDPRDPTGRRMDDRHREAQQQLRAVEAQIATLESRLAGPAPHPSDIPGAEERLGAEITNVQRNREIETLAFNQLQQRLTSPTGLSDIENQRLDTIFGEAAKRGEEDLLQFADELAGGRGLRLSDTPIAAPLLRERQRGLQGLESIRAQTGLDLQSRGLLAAQGLREFQEGLRQQAFQNRFALMGQLTQPLQSAGIGLQERIAQPTTTMTQSPNYGQLLGGIGGLALGAGLGFPGLGASLGSSFGSMFGGGGGGFAGGLGSAQGLGQIGINPSFYNSPIGPIRPF